MSTKNEYHVENWEEHMKCIRHANYTVHILTHKDYRRKKQMRNSEAPNKQQIIESNGNNRPENLSTPNGVNKLAGFKFMVSRHFHTFGAKWK